jgi:hypothetical protein
MYGDQHTPDGLEETDIDALLTELRADRHQAPHPTTALLDGTALQRRERREAQRLLGATVRVLRVHGPLAVPAGTEAA